MKHLLLTLFSAATIAVSAQTADPVIMTINGKDITRSEFEYSFNKNGNVEGAVEQKSVEEYVEMFVNYKLKVAAAEAARMDTLSSFQKEFRQYRDMQLTPYLVDNEFIDSVAYSLYSRTANQLKGQDMLRVSHILVMVKQGATDAEKEVAKQKADSIYNELRKGADFLIFTGGMSVDPDDLTPTAIRKLGAEIVSYGVPSQPGNMTLVAYLGEIPILGVPGAAIKLPTTVFDVLLPQIFAGDRISREELTALADGGLCQMCSECHWPNCTFGRY